MKKANALDFLISIINSPKDFSNESIISHYLLENLYQIENIKIKDIAEFCYLSEPTVRSFLKSTSACDFIELKKLIKAPTQNRLAQLKRCTDDESLDGINSLFQFFELDKYQRELTILLNKINQANHIYLIGSTSVTNNLTNFQKDMFVMNKPVYMHLNYEDVPYCKNDLLIFISQSGRRVSEYTMYVNAMSDKDCDYMIISADIFGSPIIDEHYLYFHSKNEAFYSHYILIAIFDYIRINYFKHFYLTNYEKEKL